MRPEWFLDNLLEWMAGEEGSVKPEAGNAMEAAILRAAEDIRLGKPGAFPDLAEALSGPDRRSARERLIRVMERAGWPEVRSDIRSEDRPRRSE